MDIVNLEVRMLLMCVRRVLKFRKTEKLPGPLIGFTGTEPTCALVGLFSEVYS